MNMGDVGQLAFAHRTGQSDRIAADDSFAVIALRVSRVIGQHRQRTLSIPKADQLHVGVDHSLRRVARLAIGRKAPPHVLHIAIGSQNAPIGGNFLDPATAQSQVRHRLRFLDRLADSRGSALDGPTCEIDVEHLVAQAGAGQDIFRQKITARRVMLVQRMHRDAIDARARCLGQRLAPGLMAVIADPHPIHRAQHDGLSAGQQHQAARGQGILDLCHRRHCTIAQRCSQWRRGIDSESRNPQRRFFLVRRRADCHDAQ